MLPPTTTYSATMNIILKCSENIISRYKSGYTEAFYQRMLQTELYHRGIPSLSEVDVFMMSGAVPVHVGKQDLEVDHRIILELKCAPQITKKHIQQLRKYTTARASTGV